MGLIKVRGRLQGVVLVLASFVVARYSWNLDFPWWIPLQALCAATMFVGFRKVLD